MSWDAMFPQISTGSGFWSPLVWGAAMLIILLIALGIRKLGKKDYKEKTGQTQAFLSGNPEYEKEQMHVKASNMYWGFMESMKWLYKSLNKIHTGVVSDYVLWFIVVLAVLFIVLGVI